MEDDVNYVSVVFKNRPSPQTESKEEQTIYSEVKIKPASAAAAADDTVGPPPQTTSAPSSSLRCLQAALIGSLCVILVSTVALVYLSVWGSGQRVQVQNLSSEMSRLQEDSARLMGLKAELQNQSHILKRDMETLNWTLQVILSFREFPVSVFCPDKQCSPCLNGWKLFENSCYLFYEIDIFKTWEKSQAFCRDRSSISELVIVDSLQEQEFLHKHIQFYYDKFHGYWMGLSQQKNLSWVWEDGRQDTLGFWMKMDFGKYGPRGLLIPQQNVTESWDPAEGQMLNKFICESKALMIN
ncbi:unnamed protein product [Knipowitschia caucasica]|uniref:C-type lectin domain-containing protein n=1 Tax=Knipowitschia caucasica TaxID=637954 RepID=A0AAV2MGB7_KNICA